jgi:molybdate transport system substrate-binding protein
MRRVVALLVAAVLLSACGGEMTVSGTAGGPIVNVYAASSLKGALTKAKASYEAAHPGTTVQLSTDSSAALEAKIEQGAPADVLLSADTTTAQKIVERRLAKGGVVTFARNRLAIVVPAGDSKVRTPADLAAPGVKVVAAGDAVPITRYASQLVAALASQPGYPADFAARYAANVVSREDNAAAVETKIELGEGDAAIVYATDAAASRKLDVIEIPAAANVTAAYGGVVIASSPNEAGGEAFLAWLAGPGGQSVLASYGFQAP